MNTELKNTEYGVWKSQDNPIEFLKVPSFNEEAIDYNRLMNLPIAYSLPNASTTIVWWTRLSIAPVSSTIPIAVWDNDPRLVKNVKIWSATIGTVAWDFTISAWFQPNLIRITATNNSNSSALWQSSTTSLWTVWVGFDFNTATGTTALSNLKAIDIQVNGFATTGTLTITSTGGTITFSVKWLSNVFLMWEAIG